MFEYFFKKVKFMFTDTAVTENIFNTGFSLPNTVFLLFCTYGKIFCSRIIIILRTAIKRDLQNDDYEEKQKRGNENLWVSLLFLLFIQMYGNDYHYHIKSHTSLLRYMSNIFTKPHKIIIKSRPRPPLNKNHNRRKYILYYI